MMIASSDVGFTFRLVVVFFITLPLYPGFAYPVEPSMEIVTLIEDGDNFPGVKSRQKIYWLNYWMFDKHSYETNTTDIQVGEKLFKVKSKGDDFKYSYNEKSSILSLSGKTASGLTMGIGPFINYKFRFEAGAYKVRVAGCHDGYPSYKIIRNGEIIYYHKHKKLRLWKLFGECDVKVDFRYYKKRRFSKERPKF